jgi:hypothetical protein
MTARKKGATNRENARRTRSAADRSIEKLATNKSLSLNRRISLARKAADREFRAFAENRRKSFAADIVADVNKEFSRSASLAVKKLERQKAARKASRKKKPGRKK